MFPEKVPYAIEVDTLDFAPIEVHALNAHVAAGAAFRVKFDLIAIDSDELALETCAIA